MITPSDFIRIPYSEDLSHAGVTYACRSLSYTYNRMGGDAIKRLQRIVAGIAVELAFRRHLSANEVPFDMLGHTPFTDPDKYDIAIGGRPCDLKSYLIYRKPLISQVGSNPQILLGAEALVPVEQVNAEKASDEDIYIFGFLNGLLTHTRDDYKRAVANGQPAFLMYPFPQSVVTPASFPQPG